MEDPEGEVGKKLCSYVKVPAEDFQLGQSGKNSLKGEGMGGDEKGLRGGI